LTTDKQAGDALRELCTWRIGGVAREIFRPPSPHSFASTLHKLHAQGARFHVLGRCSNVLFSSGGVNEPLVLTSDLAACSMLREHPRAFEMFKGAASDVDAGRLIYVEAGASNAKLLALAGEKGLAGVECLSGVPGSFGGAVAMNAEGILESLGDNIWLSLAHPATGAIRVQPASELAFAYRTCGLEDAYVVAALLRLHSDAPEAVRSRMKQRLDKRSASQPLEWPSAGCVFRNPPDGFAGALLDRAGMKGISRGDAVYSDKHANFILNLGNATSGEVLELMALGKRAVKEAFGRCLMPEVKFIGSFPAETLAFLHQNLEGEDGET
jgi:UDP-N-acetylmuramate dehydrogenase